MSEYKIHLEKELQKIVLMTEIVCATENHTIQWVAHAATGQMHESIAKTLEM